MLREIERRIFVEEELLNNEYSFFYGENKDTEVTFTYFNVRKDRESSPIYRNYRECLELARERANDGRYKNYEFLIVL